MRPWTWLYLATAGVALGLAILRLLPSQASASESMPLVCKAPDPRHIDGLCWDGKTTRNLAKGYGVVELEDGVYLVGYPE
jgi:hypothetical protein